MSGRPPKPKPEIPLDRQRLVQELLGNLETHRTCTEREALERRLGRKLTDEDRKLIKGQPRPRPKT